MIQAKAKSVFHAYYVVILGAWILFMGFCYLQSFSRSSKPCPNWEETQRELSKYVEAVEARQEMRLQDLQKLVIDRLSVIDVKQKSITDTVGRIGRLPQSIGRLSRSQQDSSEVTPVAVPPLEDLNQPLLRHPSSDDNPATDAPLLRTHPLSEDNMPTQIVQREPREATTVPIDYLIPVKTDEKACWTLHPYVGFFIPEHSLNRPNHWTSLEDAKAFCEQIGKECSGITQTLFDGITVYEARHNWELRPNPPKEYQESSWLKYSCTRSIVEQIKLYDQPSEITNKFFDSRFRCESSSAHEAKKFPHPIERIWIWGERNSGTGMMQRLMNINFDLKEEVIGGLPWKHGFMSEQSLKDMSTTLNIFLVKDAYGWLTSMKANPFHARAFEDLPWPFFLTREWFSEVDSMGEVDRNPYTHQRFANILQLRSAKLRDWVKVRDCLPYHYTLRYEDLIKNTTQVILDIAKQFELYGLRMKHKDPISEVCVVHYGLCRPIDKENQQLVIQAKTNYYLSRLYLLELAQATQKYISQNLDYEVERLVGYSYSSNNFTYLDQVNPGTIDASNTTKPSNLLKRRVR